MSYARKGLDGSDVYVYYNGNHYVCQDCSIWPRSSLRKRGIEYIWTCETAAVMAKHLEAHRAAGECVPEHALERLRDEGKP